jgi:DnaJ-domain-containing protein 1
MRNLHPRTVLLSASAAYLQLDDDAIKAAYCKLAMQLHPDRQMGKGERSRAKACMG